MRRLPTAARVAWPWIERVDWFNRRGVLEPIGYAPPAEYEARYYDQDVVDATHSPSDIPVDSDLRVWRA
jgi:transposase InsO family protein